jgi:hypothetical protein
VWELLLLSVEVERMNEDHGQHAWEHLCSERLEMFRGGRRGEKGDNDHVKQSAGKAMTGNGSTF